ncbi:threonine synthase [Oscillospiraceae bacterium MB08-C2-2]|nr:threonine synthase [Oscillospiraceae bacterium MB08-C2-2]
MNYTSTRNNKVSLSAAQVIAQGISEEGGLFVPESLPKLTHERLEKLIPMSYIQRACNILGDFLPDFTPEEIWSCVQGAYTDTFEENRPAPLSKLDDTTYMLELWHGPTCAFKDLALQLLPRLLTVSLNKHHPSKTAAILVATSGDTGKAAMEGFRDLPGTKMLVFYPRDGVSHVQKLQMQTQEGENLQVCAIEGNFDDAQTAVKSVFTDSDNIQRLADADMFFSSANSINWGRLVPQIVYYISAYCDLLADEEIALGDPINIAVPTGNFGNILAAYYAKEMGLPVGKLICASNKNKVLTDFFKTGVYNKERDFYMTSSPSMDILISSNLERLLYHLHQEDDQEVQSLMEGLRNSGVYRLSSDVKERMDQDFFGGSCDEEQTLTTIRRYFESHSYLCDTHTAVALEVLRQYTEATGDTTKTVVASTANPYKFVGSVLSALTGKDEQGDEFELIRQLHQLTGLPVPPQISSLPEKEIRFDHICTRETIGETAMSLLGI